MTKFVVVLALMFQVAYGQVNAKPAQPKVSTAKTVDEILMEIQVFKDLVTQAKVSDLVLIGNITKKEPVSENPNTGWYILTIKPREGDFYKGAGENPSSEIKIYTNQKVDGSNNFSHLFFVKSVPVSIPEPLKILKPDLPKEILILDSEVSLEGLAHEYILDNLFFGNTDALNPK